MTRAVEGARVVVTRSVAQSAELIAALERAGVSPVHLPLLEIVDAEDRGQALRSRVAQLTSLDWLVVLSPNCARRLPTGGTDAKVAAVATGTASALEERGYDVQLVPADASSTGLLEAFADVEVAGSVVIAQAQNGRRELLDGLTTRGTAVDLVVAYRNVMPELDAETCRQALVADAVVFASPSAVERYVEHVGHEPSTAVCIGKTTAATAAGHGFVVTTASAPTVPAVVDAVIVAFA